ncbi:hypothetical protein CICLE_v10010497mg [Citrus x clementina]|uniref:RWP-RK domain-containing protein n=1 Tax=Citrus clementina TaxID=85681 RepID=V4UJF1_CITCL|nr:hypothetical protein CICLE_v10010497mg [Citrus x clementina]
MADPRAIVPYHDPHDNSYTEDIFNFINNPNPTFADLSLFEEPSSIPHSTNNPQSGGIITDAGDPFDDPLFWDIGNNCNAGSFQAGPSGNQAEMSDRGTPAIENAANMKAFPRWPVPPEPYLCSCCLVLREIIHTNVQRERTGKLTLRDLMIYFHLPIEEAARRMKLCPTVVKKICRRDGLHRWPHRKV